MQFLKYEIDLWKRTKEYKGTTLQRRLILFFAMVVVCVILCFTLLLILFGITGSGQHSVYRYLESELIHVSTSAQEDMGNLSVTGIHLAEQLIDEGERISAQSQTPISELLDNRDPDLLSSYMSALLSVAENNPCGGVFLAFQTSHSEEKLPGFFIKKTQPVSSASLTANTYCLRGSTSIARTYDVELLAQWQMDFYKTELPFFDDVIYTAEKNKDLPLSRLYFWSGRLLLYGNSETGILLTLPLRTEDGHVYGVCGIEVSDRMFKQLYSPDESDYQNVFAIAAPAEGSDIDAGSGLIAGNSYLTGSQMTESFRFTGR